ncbi:outer membrane beta-barrel protein [Fangia hongkongensis]|uniref:outer membrane beta-barrel protein n=1 Tax=Fangia hongkongensis TaxID=270495 RepID=UPI0003613197|nr:outer membrane beta-barrel protein [Fangia hongkongensis]MBK2123992.1 outer membrane beta-barrel protein [Fangia hongkongensis]
MKKVITLIGSSLVLIGSTYAASSSSENNSIPKTGFFAAPAFGMLVNSGTGYRDSPEATLSIGYSFNPYFSVKAGGIFFVARDKGNQSNKFSTYSRLDAVLSLPTNTNFTPYFLTGVGALSMSSTEFAPNIGTGVAYTLSKGFALTANYRMIIPAKTTGTMSLFDIGFIRYF